MQIGNGITQNKVYIHCTSTSIVAGSEVPTALMAVQLYDPILPLCMLCIVYVDPVWRTVLGVSDLNHLHVMKVLGLALITVHTNVAICPSVSVYGLGKLDLTSGLSVTIV